MRDKLTQLAGLLVAALFMAVLGGCQNKPEPTPLAGTADNDILTFVNNAENKPIVRIGTQYYSPDTGLIDALNNAFPDYLFILDYSAAAGTGSERTMLHHLQVGTPYDLMISGNLESFSTQKKEYLVDLSAEPFLDQYLLSALNSVSIDGYIYSIPGSSTLFGIAYNVDLFQKHGWTVPTDTEAFFALCETIEKAGIKPFSTCFKYSIQVNRVLSMMCYAELYGAPEDTVWLNNLRAGKATYQGHMEPFFALAKRFSDTGVIPLDSFTASLTKERQAFWAGEYAMMDYDSAIYSYAEAENAPFAIGMMPYPAVDSENSGFATAPEYYFAIPKSVEKDPERLKLMKEVLAFLTTPEGQRAMLTGSLRISNVKGVDLTDDNPAFEYARASYDKGNLYPCVNLILPELNIQDLQRESVLSVFEGMRPEDAIDQLDARIAAGFAKGPTETVYEVLAVAEAPFTMLETSYYMADKLRQATGADVGIMINGGYFRSNLASMAAGEITSDLRRFVMKGVSAEDCVNTYRLTGAQLRACLERPIVNGTEIDALVAASGLHMTYAPWNERGSRVLEVTLSDGTALKDDQLYTVSAFNGAVDKGYIAETVAAHPEIGTLPEMMERALRQDKTIRPNLENRVTLVWPQEE